MLSLCNAYALPILFLYILFATLVMSSNKFSCILYEQTVYGKLKQGSRGINPLLQYFDNDELHVFAVFACVEQVAEHACVIEVVELSYFVGAECANLL